MRRMTAAAGALMGLAGAAGAQCAPEMPPLGSLGQPVLALAEWDADGAGVQLPRLVAGGEFTQQGAVGGDYVSVWDGEAWQPMGWGMDGPVTSLLAGDLDGAGPLPGGLFAGGRFTNVGADSTGEVTANRIARWDGTAWRALAGGLNGEVRALAMYDRDGAGPLPGVLIAAGAFTRANGVLTGPVAAWDGSAWRALGWGLDGTVSSLTLWDPDGAGPLGTQLVVGGEFHNVGSDSTGSITAHRVAHWDGFTWQPFGAGLPSELVTMVTFDFDGAGPELACPVAGGTFGVRRWVQGAWREVGTGYPYWSNDEIVWSGGELYRLATVDPDGAGPRGSVLIAGGYYEEDVPEYCDHEGCIGGYTLHYDVLTYWSGERFERLASLPGRAFAMFDADGAGSGAPVLVTGSSLAPGVHAGALPALPTVMPVPETALARQGETVHLSCVTTDATEFRWFVKRYNPRIEYWLVSSLGDGATGWGSVVSGADSPVLTISGIQRNDEASYYCVATAGCIQARSGTTALTFVAGTCSADFDHDGDAGTDADIEAFFACLAGNCCARCGMADFNGDGDSGTDADIESFFRVLAGSAC